MISFNERRETLVGETFKAGAERALHTFGSFEAGHRLLETYAFGLGGRIVDPRLHTTLAGITLEHPTMVGAGWDKKGKAVLGLYYIGAAGTEVGTVPCFGQPGNDKPRLWTIDDDHGVGLNRMGFNSEGKQAVRTNIDRHHSIPGVLGVNVGKNKDLADIHSPYYHASVVEDFNDVADYFVFNPSSPNTAGLTELQRKEPMKDHLQAIIEATQKPVFVKFSPDLPYAVLDESLEVVIEEGGAGAIFTNTSSDEDLKRQYGERWAREQGGVSGNDARYRTMATSMLRHAYEEYGDQLELVGVGGVHDTDTALEKIEAGATAIQVVTAIRPSYGKVFAQVTKGLVEFMDREGVSNIQELVGVGTKRGVKAA